MKTNTQAGVASNNTNPRKLKLRFHSDLEPKLLAISFQFGGNARESHRMQGDIKFPFAWTAVPQALSLAFLGYAIHAKSNPTEPFELCGGLRKSPAASLGDAISKKDHWLHSLFCENPAAENPPSCVQRVFNGVNVHGKDQADRRIRINEEFLPADCLEIHWEGRGSSPIQSPALLKLLRKRILISLGLPLPQAEAGDDKRNTSAKTKTAGQEEQELFPGTPNSPTDGGKADNHLGGEPKEADSPAEAQDEDTETPAAPSNLLPAAPVAARFPAIDVFREKIVAFLEGGVSAREMAAVLRLDCNLNVDDATMTDYLDGLIDELYPADRIQPHLLKVRAGEQSWDDDQPVLELQYEGDVDNWTVKHSTEGTAIFGGPGGGKSTGSGRTLASKCLSLGYGALILTTKQGEADHWCKLAGMVGRAQDVAVVCPDGYLRLNMLQYELGRENAAANMSENLVSFFKNIASVVGRHSSAEMNESFWESTGDELILNTVDTFLMSGLPVTLEGLCAFITQAPSNPKIVESKKWQQTSVFGPCIQAALDSAKSQNDKDHAEVLRQYWFWDFPTLSPNTRSCITKAFTAMVRALRTRQNRALLSRNTTITPESIFNGRIVIINLPINEYNEGGLLVQAVWKYLFQRAVLNRPDRAWGAQCRPVLLWEDEAQNTLIDFDTKFQPVCREYRVACVKLTQNISNFYARFGGGDKARSKVEAILGSLSTRLFHANGDEATNKWASEYLGTEEKLKISNSTSTTPSSHMNPFVAFFQNLFSKPSYSVSQEIIREPVVFPHQFTTLQRGDKGNDYVTQALFTQVGRRFSGGTPFANAFFKQELPPVLPHERELQQALQQSSMEN